MSVGETLNFCRGGGCTAKLGPAALSRVLSGLPRPTDPNLLIGAQSSDDAAVYRLRDDVAIVQTLDFFPPMLDDPYLFGQVAATNALSDIYAMGGEVKTALNIVCFPEEMDLNILGEILRGGSEKVVEAGGSLAGGHSIADQEVKYGLSVTGVVHPQHILANNTGRVGDHLILTKPLGVGLLCTAARLGQADENAFAGAVRSMTTLNKYAAQVAAKYRVHAATDVTGFGLLGHLHEMMRPDLSARIHAHALPVLDTAYDCANEFYLTAAGQRNRNFAAHRAVLHGLTFAQEEVLFDPQTSGGLLLAVASEDAPALLEEIRGLGLPCGDIGQLLPRLEAEIIVEP
ncbi:MAG TPA: selenide, water dikinase SelD [Candidatus Enterenecus avicola]|nr:selenide, water dikinase SelD [Candidatus Enterenecus avicola]